MRCTEPNHGAFARPASKSKEDGPIHEQAGLTKKEYLAAMAMQGILTGELATKNIDDLDLNKIANTAISAAYYLIRELNNHSFKINNQQTPIV